MVPRSETAEAAGSAPGRLPAPLATELDSDAAPRTIALRTCESRTRIYVQPAAAVITADPMPVPQDLNSLRDRC